MLLVNQAIKLSPEVQANLYQYIENRLVEIGELDDPYKISEAEIEKLDKELDAEEISHNDHNNQGSNELQKFWEEENPGKSFQDFIALKQKEEQEFDELVKNIAASTDKKQLWDLYTLCKNALEQEETKYDSSAEITPEEWAKLIGSAE